MTAVPYSRAAAESWADIFWAAESRLIEPFVADSGCPNNPFVIEARQPQPTPLD